ncbi:MAG: hypothetical protein ABI183_19120 [Polyangiaceae bacterium]
MKAIWIAAPLLILVAACGGSTNSGTTSSSGSSSLAGAWSGTWKSNSGAGGTVSMSITQTGNALSGTASMTSSTCLENAKVDGTINGDDVLINVTSGDTKASVHLTVTAPDQIDGTYDAVSAGICSGDTGIVDATR